MRAVVLLVMLLLAPAIDAQQIYKCVRDREVSYQSAPCDRTQNLVRQWDATPEREPTARDPDDRVDSARPRRVAGTHRARSTSNQRNTETRKPSLSRCDAAKARRETKLKAVGLKRTYDLLSKLDDVVNEACK